MGEVCVLTGDRGEAMNWESRESSPIRRAYELNNQSPISSGLRETQILLSFCGLDHVVKDSG